MELNQILATLRKERGLSQLELAEAVQVSRQAVSKWEVGTSVPSVENLKCLSELYQIPIDNLLFRVESSSRGRGQPKARNQRRTRETSQAYTTGPDHDTFSSGSSHSNIRSYKTRYNGSNHSGQLDFPGDDNLLVGDCHSKRGKISRKPPNKMIINLNDIDVTWSM